MSEVAVDVDDVEEGVAGDATDGESAAGGGFATGGDVEAGASEDFGSASFFLALATLARRESLVTRPPVISRSTPVVESNGKFGHIDKGNELWPPTYEINAGDNHDRVYC